MPSSLLLDYATRSLTVQTDEPVTYRIFGDSANELRKQMQQCAPSIGTNGGAEYAADTSYNLSWQYDLSMGDDCRVLNAKVGIHTSMVLPSWQPASTALPGLATEWQSFIADLHTHEQGHVTIDVSYANKLASDMSQLHAIDCDSLKALVASVVQADTLALNQANDAYDAQTNHGATQGAMLP